jgi:hypothetical protein
MNPNKVFLSFLFKDIVIFGSPNPALENADQFHPYFPQAVQSTTGPLRAHIR